MSDLRPFSSDFLLLLLVSLPLAAVLWKLNKVTLQKQQAAKQRIALLEAEIAAWEAVKRLLDEQLDLMKSVSEFEPYSEEWMVICPALARINAEIAAAHPQSLGASSAQVVSDFYASLSRGEFDVEAARTMMRDIIARASEVGDEETVATAESNLIKLSRFS